MQNQQGISKINVLGGGHSDAKEGAQLSNFVGCIAISDLVKTTLGPKGMDKILQSQSTHEVQVTNDGATILNAIHLDNPAAKVLVNISKTQDTEVGDGTTSVCVLAGELIRQSEALINQNIHPQTICKGFRLAAAVALKTLTESAKDNSGDEALFRADLMNIARTTLSSKILHQDKEHFAKLCVDAVLRLDGSTDLERISIIKKLGASMHESYLDDGFILEKRVGMGQPKRVENAKILLANTAMDADRIKIFSTKVKTSDMAEVARIEEAERQRMFTKVQKILAHGVNVFINRQLIYNLPEQFFADQGVAGIEHADFEGIERLGHVLAGDVVSTFSHPELVTLGTAELMEEIFIGQDRVIRFSGCGGGSACSIVLRGSSQHFLAESERSIHDALCVLSQTVNEPRTVLGAGCSEMLMAEAVDKVARETPGKVSLAIFAFANALRQIPTILSDNAGFDTADIISGLRAKHSSGHSTAGIDFNTGGVGDAAELAITESYKVKSQIVRSAAEAAEMILRVDEIVRSAPRQRDHDPRYG